MGMQLLEIKTTLQIAKPCPEVFEAIVNPEKMSNYFISKSSGIMEAGKHLIWQFHELESDFSIRVDNIEVDKYISFYWVIDDIEQLVEINIISVAGNCTIVKVTEKSRENNEAGINWLKGNTEGWANFLACLKAYLEYGINLRKGAFDFLKVKLNK